MRSRSTLAHGVILVALAMASAAGCRAGGGEGSETKPSRAIDAESAEAKTGAPKAEVAAMDAANATATALVTELKARLTSAMSEGGPSSALDVCAQVGQRMTADIGREHDVRVGRSSLRLRNEANEGPAWVTEWLVERGERPVAGVSGFERIVETSEGKVARVLRPIGVEKPCLHCHGPSDGLAPEIRAGLAEHYPDDAATGYAVGDLRGALWAQAPVND